MARTSGFSLPTIGRSLRLTPRLVLYMMMVGAVPVTLIAYIGLDTGSRGIIRHSEAHLESVASLKAQEVERWFRPLEATSQVLAASKLVRDEVSILVSDDADSAAAETARLNLFNYFGDLARRDSSVQRVEIISSEDEILLATNRPNTSLGQGSLLPYERKSATGKSVYLSPYMPGEQTPTALITAPIDYRGNTIAYVVLLASPVPLYETLVPDTGLGNGAKVYLVNQDGEALTPPQEFNPGSETIRASGLMASGGDVTATGLRYQDFLGQDVLAAYHSVGPAGWGVVVEVPTAEALGDVTWLRLGIVGTSASFLILLLLVAVLVARNIARPLKTLMEGARAVGAGNLNHRIEVSSSDEIGMLADSFNQMAEDLRESQARVVDAERTAALQVFAEVKVDQLRQLSRMGLLIATESSLSGLVRRTPRIAKEITGADLAVLMVLDEEGNEVEEIGTTDLEGFERISHYLKGPGLLWSCLRVQLEDGSFESIESSQRFGDMPSPFNSVLSAPLRSEEGVLVGGVIVANVEQEGTFSEEDAELIQIIAGYSSAALQKLRKQSRLQQSEQKALDALKELNNTQQQLVQAQKMEAVGQLAGGVAHDFNNLLTAIMGYAQLAVMTLPPGDHPRTEIQEIQKAGERASNLTSQLLAFSRRQIIEPKIVDLNGLVANMENMMRRLIGEDIELVTEPFYDLKKVKVDPGQVEQVLMNMVVNSRDAMLQGGKITIRTANAARRDIEQVWTNGSMPDSCVILSVSDSGTGIPDEILGHIFEPFFSTKELGKGTGLGLATCYGIVEQNGGHIEVQSEPGEGTTFNIYLPGVDAESPATVADKGFGALPVGTETVLLVEDEPLVRELGSRILSCQGYKVLEAENGVEALSVAAKHAPEGIDILFTDVVMPQMGGKELAERMLNVCPGIRVLFTSGYTDDAIVSYGVLEEGTNFIQKPFLPEALALKVREVLTEDGVNAMQASVVSTSPTESRA